MTGFITTFRERMEKRARFNRTLHELQHLPEEISEDLGINPEDARRLAHKAVYG